jgi:hypothetical protein
LLPPTAPALAVYGSSMTDFSLLARLSAISIPTLVLWGERDEIVGPDYGRPFAEAIPNAEFRLLTQTGHVPQIETPRAAPLGRSGLRWDQTVGDRSRSPVRWHGSPTGHAAGRAVGVLRNGRFGWVGGLAIQSLR